MAVVGFLVLAASTAYFLRANIYSPVQRDGSLFLFMANNIAHGQPPYWASFETKNPLVEYYFAAWIAVLRGHLSVIRAARVAEHAWMLLSAALLAWLCAKAVAERPTQRSSSGWVAPVTGILGGLVYLGLILNWVVTDDGFNIAMYQTLPELACILIMLRIARQPTPLTGLALGACLFAAWFVKQTSPMAVVLPLLLIWAAGPHRWRIARALAPGVVVPLAMVAGFLAHLRWSGTLDHYITSAMRYKWLISSHMTVDLFAEKLWANLPLLPLLRTPCAYYHTALLYLFPVVVVWFCIDVFRWIQSRRLNARDRISLVLCGWFIGSMGQAMAGLLFFRHYFLSSLAPAIGLTAALACRWRSCHPVMTLALAVLTLMLHAAYWRMPAVMRDRYASAPIHQTVSRIRTVIPSGARVFLWGGLSHYFLETGQASDYPCNMWWPFIMDGVSAVSRDAALCGHLKASPPDFFIELYEEYPVEQRLRPVRLTMEMMKAWTGHDYALVLETPARPGRYGVPAKVYARRDGCGEGRSPVTTRAP